MCKLVWGESKAVLIKKKGNKPQPNDVVWGNTESGQTQNVHKKRRKMLKEELGSLLRRRYNIYSVSPGMLRSRLLSSHSSVLMLNFQNFYITKGPTTSSREIPCKYKIRAPAPSAQRADARFSRQPFRR